MAEPFQIFISFKNTDNGLPTEDSRIAGELYEEFHKMGFNAFYSNVKLLELGASVYKKSIEQALDEAHVLIVVGTKAEYLNTEWVSYERESFHDDILAGRKSNASIIPYLSNPDGKNVPRSLRGYETFIIGKHTPKEVAIFAKNFLEGEAKKEEVKKSIATGKSVSSYSPDHGKEFRRLKIQSDNTRAADMPAIHYVLDRLPKKDKIFILDAGCAYGYVTKDRFADIENAFIVGVDVNDACLEYARKNNSAENIVYEHLQLEDENLEEALDNITAKYGIEYFDIIFASLVIHHLKNPNKFLKRMRKYLSKDGFIIIRGSDDGSVIAVNDDGLVKKVIDKHLSAEGISDRLNGRKIYSQLISSGYKNVKMINYVKEISGMDIDQRNDIFEERFAYRRNYLKNQCELHPYDLEKKSDLEFMDFVLECLENKFSEDAFWYCEIDFVGVAQKK